MECVKSFKTGGSQVVRLPKSCQFQEGELLASRIGSVVILMPRNVFKEEISMECVKSFKIGGSRVVKLPKSCQFQERQLLVNRIGNTVTLVPKNDPWKGMIEGVNLFTDDFLQNGIEDLPVQERESL